MIDIHRVDTEYSLLCACDAKFFKCKYMYVKYLCQSYKYLTYNGKVTAQKIGNDSSQAGNTTKYFNLLSALVYDAY